MKFKILWIDDNMGSIKTQQLSIQEFLTKRGFEPEIINLDNMENISKDIDENLNEDLDLLITDNNLDEDFSGEDVINKIKRKRLFIDVLFYSFVKKIDQKKMLGIYNFIEFVESKSKILDPLKNLIKKNIKRCEDIAFLRGFVLSRIIDMELALNELFEKYFNISEKARDNFHNFLMENSAFSLHGKRMILGKIHKEHQKILGNIKSIKLLEGLLSDRNHLAHCKIDSEDKNCLISMGDKKRFDRDKLKEILRDINKVMEEIDQLNKKITSIHKKK